MWDWSCSHLKLGPTMRTEEAVPPALLVMLALFLLLVWDTLQHTMSL